MSVEDLIAKAAATPCLDLSPAAISDLRAILKSNDAQPNRLKRVSATAAREYVRTKHGLAFGDCSFRAAVQRHLKRRWTS